MYLGDCLEIMPTLPDNSVDAVITDPPYGIGFKYANHDDAPQGYEDLMKAFIAEAQRICNGGPFFIWQAMLNADKWHKWFPPGFRIFAACKGFVQFRPTPIQYSWDPVIFWGDVNKKPSVYCKDYHEQRKAPFGKNRPKIEHPCPRPLEQVAEIVKRATNENDCILDSFMGSGTTGVVCVQTGRRFIGIEIDEGYFEIAKKRIMEAQQQMRMAL